MEFKDCDKQFMAAIAAAEREACAQMVDHILKEGGGTYGDAMRERLYEVVPYSVIVKPVGEPIFSDQATIVKMEDEAAGPFVSVEQQHGGSSGKISIEPAEWPIIKKAIDQMITLCEQQERAEANEN